MDIAFQLLIAFECFIPANSYWIETTPDPPLPIGWELNSNPNFEPCIELCLEANASHRYRIGGDSHMLKQMEGWGEECVPVLQDMFADPGFEDFRPLIAAYLGSVPWKNAQQWGNEQLRRFMTKTERSESNWKAFVSLCTSFENCIDEETVTLAKERLLAFVCPEGKQACNARDMAELCNLLRKEAPDVLADFLEQHSREGSDWIRERCIEQLLKLRSDRALEAALTLGDETTDNRLRVRLTTFLHWKGGWVRAKEPMSWILEKEQREGGSTNE
jgi:hypothetical protein